MNRLRVRSASSVACLLLVVIASAVLLQAQSPIPATSFVKYLPDVVTGAGFVTKITINNLSSSSANVVVNYISQGGALVGGSPCPSASPCTIAGNGTLRIPGDESQRQNQNPTINWAVVGSDQPITVNLFFELQSTPGGPIQSASGFSPAQPLTDARMAVELDPAHGKTLGSRWPIPTREPTPSRSN